VFVSAPDSPEMNSLLNQMKRGPGPSLKNIDEYYIDNYKTKGNDAMILGQKQLDKINTILNENLISCGIQNVILIDTAGNVIAEITSGSETIDIYSLAALAAANFGAMSCIAKIVGENEFSLLFHKGEKENIYFCRVSEEMLLINIFNNQISLGLLRLKMAKVVDELHEALAL